MPKVKNNKRQPIDIEIFGGDNLHLGPKETSRELSEIEMKSVHVTSNLRAGNIVVLEPEKPAKKAQIEKGGAEQ